MKFDIYLKRCVLASLLFLVFGAWRLMDTANGELRGLRSAVIFEVDTQVSAARKNATDEIDKQADAVLDEVAVTRKALLAKVSSEAMQTRLDAGILIEYALDEMRDVNDTLDKQATAALALADRHATIIENQAASVTTPVANIADQVKEQLPLILDCDHNPDCFFNRYVGASKGFEQTMLAVGKAAPAFASTAVETEKHIDGIAADAHKVADKFVAPATVWDRLKAVFEYVLLLAGRFI